LGFLLGTQTPVGIQQDTASGNRNSMEVYFNNMTAQEGTREKLVQDLITLVHDAEELIRATGGNLAEKSKEELLAALERAKLTCLRIEAKAAATARKADSLIRENPYHAAGVAFGLGVLIGVLVRSK
jgi:ElaB/YqjD/DUF883 family membrane-anchored ribosome-binding protein